MQSSFDGLGFHIPRSALQAYEEDLGGQHLDTLAAEPGVDIEDDVVRQLVGAYIPALENFQTVSRHFQDQITAVLTFHLCSKYGTAKLRKGPQVLLPWQKPTLAWVGAQCDSLAVALALSKLRQACARKFHPLCAFILEAHGDCPSPKSRRYSHMCQMCCFPLRAMEWMPPPDGYLSTSASRPSLIEAIRSLDVQLYFPC